MNGLRLTLIGLLSILWWWQPSSLVAPSHIDYGSGSAGGDHESYLWLPRGPGDILDVARPVPVDMQAMDGSGMLQVPEAPLPRAHPTTRGEATYYHPSLAGGLMRNGRDRYDPRDPRIVAVADVGGNLAVELDTALSVCAGGRCIEVIVRDSGLFPPHHLDLSEAAWLALSGGKPLSVGRLEIEWRVLE